MYHKHRTTRKSDSICFSIKMMKPSSELRQKWNNVGENVPVIHIFGRAYTCPGGSPFSIKLETYLRMTEVKFEPEFDHPFGPKGKCPWITLNGKEIADSQLAIEAIMKANGKEIDPHLSPEEKAVARAMAVTLEERFYWIIALDRVVFNKGKHMPEFLPPMIKPAFMNGLMVNYIARQVKGQAQQHGIGRHSREEIEKIGLADLEAFSAFLGNKPFMMGEQPSLVDASLFSMIVLVLYTTPEDNFLKKKVEGELPNLKAFVERMKERFWPDWEDCCAKRASD